MIGAVAAATRKSGQLFSFFRTPLPANYPLQGGTPGWNDSAALVAQMVKAINVQQAISGGGHLNGPYLGVKNALFVVGPDQRRVLLPVDHYSFSNGIRNLIKAEGGVPMPDDFEVMFPMSDKSASIWQPSTDTYWEGNYFQQKMIAPRWEGSGGISQGLIGSTGGSLATGITQYNVTALSSISPWLETGSAYGSPSAPHQLTTVGSGGANSKIRLSFSSRDYAAGYVIYRRTSTNGGVSWSPWVRLITLTPANSPALFDIAVNLVDSTALLGAGGTTDDGTLTPAATVDPPANSERGGNATTSEWRCEAMAVMKNVSGNAGAYETIAAGTAGGPQSYLWGPSTSRIPKLAGMISRRDVEKKRIDHVMTWAMSSSVYADARPAISGITGTANGTGPPNNDPADTLRKTAHGLVDGDELTLSGLAGGAGLTITANKFVRDATANTFKLAVGPAAAAINFTTDITALTVEHPGFIAQDRFSYPSQDCDGHSIHPAAIPYGARYTFPNDLDLAALTSPAITDEFAMIVAVAIQKYGLIVAEGSGSMHLHCRPAQSDGLGWRPGWQPNGVGSTTWVDSAPGNPFYPGVENDVLMQVFAHADLMEVVQMGWVPGMPPGQPTSPCTSGSLPCTPGGP